MSHLLVMMHGTIKNRPLALCAALLHDLGHGPFSHSFEKIFNTDHEAYTQAIITGDTEVNAVLRKVAPEFPREVAEVINKRIIINWSFR